MGVLSSYFPKNIWRISLLGEQVDYIYGKSYQSLVSPMHVNFSEIISNYLKAIMKIMKAILYPHVTSIYM